MTKEATSKANAVLKAQAAAEHANLAADAQNKAEPKLKQADPGQAEDITHPLLDGSSRQEAEGVTQDVHEADLDLSHTDNPPGETTVPS